jgi:hypothetical protein
MLDVRPRAYVTPIAEQEIGPILPVIQVENLGDEDATITGLVRIYRESLGVKLYDSELAVTLLPHAQTLEISALTPFDPGAPADDDYFIICTVVATSRATGQQQTTPLAQYYFDVKPAPMGPVPATHHTTHENGGMDQVDLTLMTGLLATPQTPASHAANHETGGSDPIDVSNLPGILMQPQQPAAHDIAGAEHTSAATPGQILQADANGLPVDATNTDDEVADAVAKRNCRANGEASNPTPTPNADTTDLYYLSALAEAAEFQAPSGSPVDGQKLILRILDDGTARALTYVAGAGGYTARGQALPAITVLGKFLYVGLIYNAGEDTWDCVATSQET